LKDTTHWIAAMTVLTSEAPSRPATLTDTRFASGATPFQAPAEAAPLPAMIPAMKVPCP
jgi:hypothetical protein